MFDTPCAYNAHLRGKMQLAKIGERSEQKANCILSLLKFLLYAYSGNAVFGALLHRSRATAIALFPLSGADFNEG
jgi:hypothetical protein